MERIRVVRLLLCLGPGVIRRDEHTGNDNGPDFDVLAYHVMSLAYLRIRSPIRPDPGPDNPVIRYRPNDRTVCNQDRPRDIEMMIILAFVSRARRGIVRRIDKTGAS